MKRFIGNALWLGIFACLVASSYYAIPGLATLSAVALWLIILLAVFVGATLLVLWAFSGDPNPAVREKTATALAKGATILAVAPLWRRALRLIKLIAMAAACAFSGLVFTTICYVLVSVLLEICIKAGRKAADDLGVAYPKP